jgi:hypothetical protein
MISDRLILIEEGKTMKNKQVLQGVPGILRPFKAYIEQCGMKPGEMVVYYGVPGTCTPFVELLGFATRDLGLFQVFVPYVDESKARNMALVKDAGMQLAEPVRISSPGAVVVMGGLSMPNVPVTAEQVQAAISRYPSAKKIGVCFMQMFQKAGWLDVIAFDLLIDARIDPVEVWQE